MCRERRERVLAGDDAGVEVVPPGGACMTYSSCAELPVSGGASAGASCVNSMCVAGASVGNNAPCGDLMPNLGELTDAQRTKILDWIALGAAEPA